MFEYAIADKLVSDDIFEVKLSFLDKLRKINNEKRVEENNRINKIFFAKFVITDSLLYL